MANGHRDLAKEQGWREMLARHVASGLSVREFCRREALRESAFHAWRRTIAQRDGQVAPRRRQITARDGQVAAAAKLKPRAALAPAFVPAVVTNASRCDGAISIALVGGRVMRLPETTGAAGRSGSQAEDAGSEVQHPVHYADRRGLGGLGRLAEQIAKWAVAGESLCGGKPTEG